MRNFLALALALVGALLACAENKALTEEAELAAPTPFDGNAIKVCAAKALIGQLWEKMDQNTYVIDKVAIALEKIGTEAGDPLAEAVREGFNQAQKPFPAEEQKRALNIARRAAMILGQIGDKVAYKPCVVAQLTHAAENCANVQVCEENRETLRDTRIAAIEALGKIFRGKGQNKKPPEQMSTAICSLSRLLRDCDFAIKSTSAEALAQIYGEEEEQWIKWIKNLITSACKIITN